MLSTPGRLQPSLMSSLSLGPSSVVPFSWPFPTAFICHSPLPFLVLLGGIFSAHFALVVSTTPLVPGTTSASALKPNTQDNLELGVREEGQGGLFLGTSRQCHLGDP